MPDELAARRERQETNTELQGGRPGAEWIWGAISPASSRPGEFAHKSLGYGWGSDPGYSPALIRRGRLQRDTHEGSVDHRLRWSTHQASAVWVCSSLRLSRKILGNSRARRKILGVICREFWENLGICIIRRHRSRVHQSCPENGVM